MVFHARNTETLREKNRCHCCLAFLPIANKLQTWDMNPISIGCLDPVCSTMTLVYYTRLGLAYYFILRRDQTLRPPFLFIVLFTFTTFSFPFQWQYSKYPIQLSYTIRGTIVWRLSAVWLTHWTLKKLLCLLRISNQAVNAYYIT